VRPSIAALAASGEVVFIGGAADFAEADSMAAVDDVES
jgi:hypothetical protein